MRNIISKALYCLLLACLSCYASVVNAEGDEAAPSDHSVLSRGYALYQEGKYQQAESLLNRARTQSQGSDLALIQQMLGYVYYAEKKYGAALNAFNAALQQKELSKKVVQKLHRALGGILILEKKQYSLGLEHLKTWLKMTHTEDHDVRVLMTIAYQGLEDYASLVNFLKDDPENTKNPSREWNELLLFSYIKLQRINEARQMLVHLIQSSPGNPVYWQQLSALYQHEKQDITTRVAIDNITYLHGTNNDEAHIFRLVNGYLAAALPYQAARLLEKEISLGGITRTEKVVLLLVNSYLLAKEPEEAIAALKKMPPSLTRTTRLAEIYFWQDRWPSLIELVEKLPLMEKEALTERSKLFLGIAYYRSNDMKNAQQFLRQIKQDKENRVLAKQWLERISTSH